MREAMLYSGLAGGAVQCQLCPHECVIAPGRRGVCGVRRNDGGMLTALTYGRAAAVNVDPIEKKPLFHFLPGTLSLSVGTVGCTTMARSPPSRMIDFDSRTIPGRMPFFATTFPSVSRR